MLNLLDSHDTNRALYVLTELGDSGLIQAKQRLQLAALFQYTYVGAPMVFYGDEVALNAPSRANGQHGPIGDPYARAPYPWPDQPGDVTVYGPPDQDVLSFYTKLGHLRKQHPTLSTGSFVTLLTGDTQQPGTAANTYAYARAGSKETAIVALNNGSTVNKPAISVAAYYPDGTRLQDALSGTTYTVTGGMVSLSLQPISGVVLLLFPATVDLQAPTGRITLRPAANAVVAQISGADTGGSGVSQIRYWADNGEIHSVAGTSVTVTISGKGAHTIGARILDKAGNVSALVSQTVKIR
jgi:hypothetical protein